MVKKKELLAAGYVRDILFRNMDECEIYLAGLRTKMLAYKILDSHTREDGSVIIRILQQYNNAPMIQLYNE